MFIICDSNNVVQDIASEQPNLSRGYTFSGYKLFGNVDVGDIRIGDNYDGKSLTPNQVVRAAEMQKQQNELLINQKTRELAVIALQAEGKLPGDYK